MSFSVYIIYPSKLAKYYVGYSEEITVRLQQHNEGISTFTSKASDWVIKYTEAYTGIKIGIFILQKLKQKKLN